MDDHRSTATGSRDQPPRGTFFATLHRRLGRLAGVSVPVIEELYGPTRREGRQQMEQRRELAEPAPAPGDPPAPDPADGSAARRRFTGLLRLRRR